MTQMKPMRLLGYTVAVAMIVGAAWPAQAAEPTAPVAGPPMAVGYGADGVAGIRFSSYAERVGQPVKPLLNLLPVSNKQLLANLSRIGADERFVYAPGETVTIHIATKAPVSVELRGLLSGRKTTAQASSEATLTWPLEAAGGKDDFELYLVEVRQGQRLVARRGFLSALPTGDIRSPEQTMGTVGWEFCEWTYSPFDIVSGFPGHPAMHGPLYGTFDSRLQPWNWVTEIYAPDLPKQALRIADWSKDPFAQPYTEWVRWYQYVGADLLAWRADSWRWGEFNSGDLEGLNWEQGNKRAGRGYLSLGGQPGVISQYDNYIVANDSIFPNGMYFREWLGQIYYAATTKACQMRKGAKPRIAEADHWNDRDMGEVPVHPRLIQLYVDYLAANKLPHQDLDAARTSAELADLLTKTGTPERRQHFRAWNMYQVNLRGRQYLWEAGVQAGIDVGFKSVDWLFGNGMVGDTVQTQGQGVNVPNDFEQIITPWALHEFQTDWDYGHWLNGSYRYAGQSFARYGAMIGRSILNPDVYNELAPHATEQSRADKMFHEWCVPQDAAEHNRMFTYTSFFHYYDFDGRPQRVVTWSYSDVYRNSLDNCVGRLAENTPAAEAHAILDHRQVSEAVTMQRPIGFVGVISSTRAKHQAAGTEYVVNGDAWAWYFETLVDCGISLPAFVNDQAIDKLPADTNLIFAPRKDGNGQLVISARAGGKQIVRPWGPRGDHKAIAEFAAAVLDAAGKPITFAPMTTGYAYRFGGNRTLVFVENMRSANVSDSQRGLTPPPGVQEMPRTADVNLDLGMPASGAQVWDLTAFLPVPPEQVKADGTRLTFTAPLAAGDGRLFVIVPAPGAMASSSVAASPAAAPAASPMFVPWADTAYEKVAYRNAIFQNPPRPYAPKNYTQLASIKPAVEAPARIGADPGALPDLTGAAPILKLIAPNAVVVIGQECPASIKAIAQKLAEALRKAGGPGTLLSAEEFNAKPVAETGRYHVLAVGTVWDNEVLQRFNDPWALDRDWYYNRLGNEPAWPWMNKTGFAVGFIGDFDRDDASVGYLCVDRSAYMWEARCRAYDDKKPPEQQMPLRFLFRISGSGPAGVVKAVQAFADRGMLNGCLPGKAAPVGDARFTLAASRCLEALPFPVPQSVTAEAGHTLRYLGWNQADAEEYDGFLARTGVAAKRIVRAKYVPEWDMSNFPASPHRASSRFELCIIAVDGAAAPVAAKLAGANAKSVQLADGSSALVTAYGTHIIAKGDRLVLESAPEPWGKALVEAYLRQ